MFFFCDPPGLLQESLGPFGPEVSQECPRECAWKRGVSGGVSDGVSPGPFGPRAPECLKSVPRVSPECLGHLFDTPETLSGHFLDTPEPGARRAPETPSRTLPRTPPVFRHTLGDTPGTLRARRARETSVAGRGDLNSSLSHWMLCCSFVALLALILCEVLFLPMKKGNSPWQDKSGWAGGKNQEKGFENGCGIFGAKQAGNLCESFGCCKS